MSQVPLHNMLGDTAVDHASRYRVAEVVSTEMIEMTGGIADLFAVSQAIEIVSKGGLFEWPPILVRDSQCA
jgi:hypothetical protein